MTGGCERLPGQRVSTERPEVLDEGVVGDGRSFLSLQVIYRHVRTQGLQGRYEFQPEVVIVPHPS